MPTGSCFCGNIKVEYSGDPAMTALCHCADCRKISGGNYSNNIVVPSANFKVTQGTPKEITKTADSGKSITSCFCPDCAARARATGTTLFRYGDSFGGIDGMRIIKAGILDDVNVLNQTKPGAELYAPERIKWVAALEGAGQIDAMPPS
ncbi:DUF636 domain protein [Cladophialophora carrionii]|uniref:DUF636 domain protein n=1 Tax=Cladophialophora carrionii TaxID=86049 RepID=A0A1C1CYA6_9EURO|nr:DUF636 domain protein [Cladophialophora carrionii]